MPDLPPEQPLAQLPGQGEPPSSPADLEAAKKNYMLSVYDPEAKSLRKLPYQDALNLGKQGYLVGTAAENYNLQNKWDESPYSKSLGRAAEWFSGLTAGGSDVAASLLLNKSTQQQIRHARANDGAWGTAINAAGFLGQAAMLPAAAFGGLALEGLQGAGLVAKGSRLAASALNAASVNALPSAFHGAAENFADQQFLGEPQSVEGLAAGAFSEMAFNAVAGMGIHALVSAPRALWSTSGNALNWLETKGLKPFYRKAEQQPAQVGPRLTRFTVGNETEVSSAIRNHEMKYRQTESGTGGIDVNERMGGFENNFNDEKIFERSTKTPKNPIVPEDPYAKPALAAKNPILQGATIEPEATKAADAVQKDGISVTGEPIRPEEVEFGFPWPEGYSKRDKLFLINKAIVARLADNPEALAKYALLADLESEIKDAGKKAALKKEGGYKKLQDLINKKKTLQVDLKASFSTEEVSPGKWVPGYKELSDEYARINGNYLNDLEDIAFGPMPKVKTKAELQAEKLAAKEAAKAEAAAKKQAAKDAMPKANGKAPKAASQKVPKPDTFTDKYKRTLTDSGNEFGGYIDTEAKLGYNAQEAIDYGEKESYGLNSDKRSIKATFVMPKIPPKTEFAGYKPPVNLKEAKDLAQILGIAGAGAGYLYDGKEGAIVGGGAPGLALGVMLAGYGVAGQRYKIGKVFYNQIVKPLEKPIVEQSMRTITKGARGSKNSEGRDKNYLEMYQPMVKTASAIAANPNLLTQIYQQQFPEFAKAHPEILQRVITTHQMGMQKLNDTAPKNPGVASLQQTDYDPPRSQKRAFVNRWQILANPDQALRSGDPQAIRLLKETYPNWYKTNVEVLQAEIAANKRKYRGVAARNVSQFLGAPVTQLNDAAAQNRLQQSAGAGSQQTPPGGGKPIGKSGGGKVSQQAAMRDDPSFSLN